MKRVWFIVCFLSLFNSGCAIDTKDPTEKSPLPPATPEIQTQDTQTHLSTLEANTLPFLPTIAEGNATFGLGLSPYEIAKLLPNLDKHHLILNNQTIVDRIEIYVVNPAAFGAQNPIVINRSTQSRYIVRLSLPHASVLTHEPKLIIDRFSDTGEHLQREYPLINVSTTPSEEEVRYQSDDNKDEKIYDYGSKGAVDHFIQDHNGDFRVETTYKQKPLFQKLISEDPQYRVSFEDFTWKAHFQDERIKMLKQLRKETHEGEREEVETNEHIHFNEMARDLFSDTLLSEEVQQGLLEQDISGISAEKVWAIRNYITIYANGRVPKATPHDSTAQDQSPLPPSR